MHNGTGPRLRFQVLHIGIERVPYGVQQPGDFAHAQVQLMHRREIRLDTPEGQAQHGAQIGDQRRHVHPDAALAESGRARAGARRRSGRSSVR
jgi:hypothetical protein